jgi:hypothetical protein
MENTDLEAILQSKCIAHTERSITEITHALETLLQHQKSERELLAEKPLLSISNPPSETSESLRHYPEQRSEGVVHSYLGAQHLKPTTPNDFLGDRTKGRAFLNSCELYINLVPHQFVDDHTKIMWAFLFMKSDCATRFVDRQMQNYQTVGSLPYSTWSDFVQEFIDEFCPKNETLMAHTDLETSRYYQGTKTVDDFHEMIANCAKVLSGPKSEDPGLHRLPHKRATIRRKSS